MMSVEDVSDTPRRVLLVHVATIDGVSTRHVYPLWDVESAQVESRVDFIQQDIRNARTGRTPLLSLDNPNILYKVEHVVRVAFENTTLEELTLSTLEESEDRGPIGFRPT